MYNERALVVITLLKLLQGSLAASAESNETYSPDHYERVFLFCLTWSVGALLDLKDRTALDAELASFGSNLPPRENGDTIFEYLVDAVGKWVHWNT